MKAKKYLSNYFCEEHPNQKLNLVCIEQTCPKRGLICSICKNDEEIQPSLHTYHLRKVVPFKTLIESLQKSMHRAQTSNRERQEPGVIKMLQEIHMKTMYLLNDSVVQLSNLVQKMQRTLIDVFQQSKSSIMLRSEKVRKFNSIIERSLIHDVRKFQKYELMADIRGFVPFIKQNEDQQFRSRFETKINPCQILAEFMLDNENFMKKCGALKKFISNIEVDLFSAEISIPRQEEESQYLLKRRKRSEKQEKLKEKASSNANPVPIQTQIKQQKMEAKKQVIQKEHKKSHKKKIQLFEEDIQPPKQVKPQKQGFKKKKNVFQQLQNLQSQTEEKQSSQIQPKFINAPKQEPIVLTHSMKVARQTNSQGFAFLNLNILTEKSISFRIRKLKKFIMIGVGNVQLVNAYKCGQFNPQSPTHGVIGLGHKGLYLNYKQQPVSKETNNCFIQNDVISVGFKKQVLYFERCAFKHKKGGYKGKDSWNFEVKLKVNESQLKKLYFCVYLGGIDDTVQIL